MLRTFALIWIFAVVNFSSAVIINCVVNSLLVPFPLGHKEALVAISNYMIC